MLKKNISIYNLIISCLNILLINCSNQLKCELLKNEKQCIRNKGCQWCNSQWGCMTNINSTYECPIGKKKKK